MTEHGQTWAQFGSSESVTGGGSKDAPPPATPSCQTHPGPRLWASTHSL